MQSKSISPKVSIDSYDLDLLHDIITAYVAVEGEEDAVIFSINQGDFEKFCDDNELREWTENRWTVRGGVYEDHGTYDWNDIYSKSIDIPFCFLSDLLKAYIEHLYLMEATDIEIPLKQILSTHKAAI